MFEVSWIRSLTAPRLDPRHGSARSIQSAVLCLSIHFCGRLGHELALAFAISHCFPVDLIYRILVAVYHSAKR